MGLGVAVLACVTKDRKSKYKIIKKNCVCAFIILICVVESVCVLIVYNNSRKWKVEIKSKNEEGENG